MPASRTRTTAVKKETIDAILSHFGSRRRAYEGLQMDGTLSASDFYTVMRGEPCTPAVAADVAYAWGALCRIRSPERLGAAVEAFARKLGDNPSEADIAAAMRFWLSRQEQR
ncbi:hypothetical protein [Jannaschia sp. 2305UL9-9]|uniref:hypothetical protein n=1 Tax=Jannaschia sp. 2305UL9-9 TaxID=3121638 RepID=UPI0035272081